MSDFSTATNRLIIFTRCPELGRCKTRLVPVIGEQGAKLVHESLVRQTMSWIHRTLDEGIAVEVRYTGDDLEGLKHLCEAVAGRVVFRVQEGADLGERLAEAQATAFSEGASKVAIIGTDCPQLSDCLIAETFRELSTQNLVLGPAQDGGYYLIATDASYLQLFAGIGWSGASVLVETIERANFLKLSLRLLEELTDVDRPEDLKFWQAEHQVAPRP